MDTRDPDPNTRDASEDRAQDERHIDDSADDISSPVMLHTRANEIDALAPSDSEDERLEDDRLVDANNAKPLPSSDDVPSAKPVETAVAGAGSPGAGSPGATSPGATSPGATSPGTEKSSGSSSSQSSKHELHGILVSSHHGMHVPRKDSSVHFADLVEPDIKRKYSVPANIKTYKTNIEIKRTKTKQNSKPSKPKSESKPAVPSVVSVRQTLSKLHVPSQLGVHAIDLSKSVAVPKPALVSDETALEKHIFGSLPNLSPTALSEIVLCVQPLIRDELLHLNGYEVIPMEVPTEIESIVKEIIERSTSTSSNSASPTSSPMNTTSTSSDQDPKTLDIPPDVTFLELRNKLLKVLNAKNDMLLSYKESQAQANRRNTYHGCQLLIPSALKNPRSKSESYKTRIFEKLVENQEDETANLKSFEPSEYIQRILDYEYDLTHGLVHETPRYEPSFMKSHDALPAEHSHEVIFHVAEVQPQYTRSSPAGNLHPKKRNFDLTNLVADKDVNMNMHVCLGHTESDDCFYIDNHAHYNEIAHHHHERGRRISAESLTEASVVAPDRHDSTSFQTLSFHHHTKDSISFVPLSTSGDGDVTPQATPPAVAPVVQVELETDVDTGVSHEVIETLPGGDETPRPTSAVTMPVVDDWVTPDFTLLKRSLTSMDK